jgi:hypothetical protein
MRSYDALVHKVGFFSIDPRNQLTAPQRRVIPFRTFGVELYKEKDGVQYISSRHGELYPIEKPKGSFRIVCFGGSTTDQKIGETHYPLLLQTILRERLHRNNIEVINVGNQSYATPHFLILLELNVIYWKPDLIILSENINDLLAQYWPHFTFDYSNRYSDPFYSIPNYESRYTLANLIFKHSRLFWFIKSRMKTKQQWPAIKRKSYGDTPNPMAIKVFEQNLRSFITLAKSNRIQVLLATQPLQPSEEYFVRHYTYKSYNDTVLYPLHNEFVANHNFYNNIIKKVARDTGETCIDNDHTFGGNKEYFIDSVHYTEDGIKKLANSYADFIIEHTIIK